MNGEPLRWLVIVLAVALIVLSVVGLSKAGDYSYSGSGQYSAQYSRPCNTWSDLGNYRRGANYAGNGYGGNHYRPTQFVERVLLPEVLIPAYGQHGHDHSFSFAAGAAAFKGLYGYGYGYPAAAAPSECDAKIEKLTDQLNRLIEGASQGSTKRARKQQPGYEDPESDDDATGDEPAQAAINRCAKCHAEGGIGKPTFVDGDGMLLEAAVKKYRKAMLEAVRNGSMPPKAPLPAEQIAALKQKLFPTGGAPRDFRLID